MAFIPITHKPEENPNPKLAGRLSQLNQLLEELSQRELPETMATYINSEITKINQLPSGDPNLHKGISKTQGQLLRRLEKELKIVPKGYYKQLWLVLGMSVFGIPMGVALGMSLGSMAFLGIGLPIGMAIGVGLGSSMDQKAAKEGRQLHFKPSGTV